MFDDIRSDIPLEDAKFDDHEKYIGECLNHGAHKVAHLRLSAVLSLWPRTCRQPVAEHLAEHLADLIQCPYNQPCRKGE